MTIEEALKVLRDNDIKDFIDPEFCPSDVNFIKNVFIP